ncbi:hypothetical protein [Planococcus dechangensis]|uniref:TerB family tellurite resistance protein n=1 Tax=Planococcus dechangensis TaxID=1176255 RepID=A0ABV9MBC5_9BACL
MEVEWMIGIAATAIAAVSGFAIAKKRTKKMTDITQEQKIRDEFVAPLLPELMSFYQLGILGVDPFETIDSEKLLKKFYDYSLGLDNPPYDRHDALGHLRELTEQMKGGKKELLEAFFWYLDFSNGILKDTVKAPHPILREARQLQKQYAVWFICYEELEEDAPDSIPELIRYSDYFSVVLKDIELSVFRNMMDDEEMRQQRRGNFVRIIFQSLEKEAQGEEELAAIRQFHDHYDKRYTHRHKGEIRF